MMAAADAPGAPRSARASSLVRAERRPDGVVVLTLGDPADAHATITPRFVHELRAALGALFADEAARAVVLRGGASSFVVGANIAHVRALRYAQDAEDEARDLAQLASMIEKASKPIVAYVHGPALGGGFELALACAAAVATDDPTTALGLPEVKLGLIPAGGGLARIAARAGLRVALDLGVTGRTVRPAEARALGLLDDVVAPAIGLEAAAALARRLAADAAHARTLARRRTAGRSPIERALVEGNPLGRAALFRKLRRELAGRTRGNDPARDRVVELLARLGSRGARAAADAEARAFGDLAVSETARRLIDVFAGKMALKKDTGLEPGESAAPLPVERVAILGAGLMGSGIAAVTAQAGLFVRMKDTEDVAVGRGLRAVRDSLEARARRGAMTPLGRDAALERVTGATAYAGFRGADLVIEAVFEELDLKHAIIREIEGLVRDTCVIASSTSSIPIAEIARASSRPERIVGMHYGRPVPRTPLLEVVRTRQADPRAIATAVAIGKRQGKTVIVVRDGYGFYTTRILMPLLNEAAHLLSEGSSVEAVDRAMLDWGLSVGPLAAIDDIGIDVSVQAIERARGALGERMRLPSPLAALRADDRRGRKNARGFYLYGRHAPRRRTVDETVYAAAGVSPRTKAILPDEIRLRCSLALVNEALRCYEDGILRSVEDGDLGAILGVGFPAFRGGPFRYVDVIGAAEVLRQTRTLEQRFGARFEPAPLLVEMARRGRRFYG